MKENGTIWKARICRSVAHWIAPNETPRVSREGLFIFLSVISIRLSLSLFPPTTSRITRRQRGVAHGGAAAVNKINSKTGLRWRVVGIAYRLITSRLCLRNRRPFRIFTWLSGYQSGICFCCVVDTEQGGETEARRTGLTRTRCYTVMIEEGIGAISWKIFNSSSQKRFAAERMMFGTRRVSLLHPLLFRSPFSSFPLLCSTNETKISVREIAHCQAKRKQAYAHRVFI